jgi:hypothetical protein
MLFEDTDPELLIARLAGPLAPSDRDAFRAAAESALEQLPCAGEGLAYRVVVTLWRGYFHPPQDASWDISQELESLRRSRLVNKPAIEYGGDLRHIRYRKLQAVE